MIVFPSTDDGRCRATTRAGQRCRRPICDLAWIGCWQHATALGIRKWTT